MLHRDERQLAEARARHVRTCPGRAREIDLQESPQHPTGYWAGEALLPYQRFVEAGAHVVVTTPDGVRDRPWSRG